MLRHGRRVCPQLPSKGLSKATTAHRTACGMVASWLTWRPVVTTPRASARGFSGITAFPCPKAPSRPIVRFSHTGVEALPLLAPGRSRSRFYAGNEGWLPSLLGQHVVPATPYPEFQSTRGKATPKGIILLPTCGGRGGPCIPGLKTGGLQPPHPLCSNKLQAGEVS